MYRSQGLERPAKETGKEWSVKEKENPEGLVPERQTKADKNNHPSCFKPGLIMCFRREVELKGSLVINKENLKESCWGMLPKTKTWEINLFFGVNFNFH